MKNLHDIYYARLVQKAFAGRHYTLGHLKKIRPSFQRCPIDFETVIRLEIGMTGYNRSFYESIEFDHSRREHHARCRI